MLIFETKIKFSFSFYNVIEVGIYNRLSIEYKKKNSHMAPHTLFASQFLCRIHLNFDFPTKQVCFGCGRFSFLLYYSVIRSYTPSDSYISTVFFQLSFVRFRFRFRFVFVLFLPFPLFVLCSAHISLRAA